MANDKTQATLRIVLCVMLAGGVVGVYFFTHFLPFGYKNRRELIQVRKADYEKKSTELARARASVADLPRFEAEYEQLHARWSMAAELLPTDKQSSGLLRKITLAGQQSGVAFLMFKPGAVQSQTYYSEMPMEIVVRGGYHQIGSFLADLANMRRIVTVANVRIASAPNNDDGATTVASFSASSYSLTSTATQVAPPTTSAPAGEAAKPADDSKKGGASHGQPS